MKKTLPYIKTKWKKINITKDIQFKTKQAKYSLHIYTKWQKMLRHYFKHNFTLKNLNIFTKT